jgi:hypothetical protein
MSAQRNRAATVKAAELDTRIAEAETALNAVDTKAAVKEADPQSASMAKAVGADRNIIAALSHAFFAIAIELGSGVGFWLVFGHGAPSRPREGDTSLRALVPIDRATAQGLQVIDDEKPQDIVERFFPEVVRPALGRRIQSLAVWSAYVRWCSDRGVDAVSHARFGRLARWRKDRIGGAVWYLDCELAEDYARLGSSRTTKALPRFGTMTKGTHIAH